jgi:hypothetical protein
MRQFKDLGIKTTLQSFTGDKIKMDKVLNRQIVVIDFKIEKSKYGDKGNGKCLYMQIQLGEEKRVLFSGAVGLMDTIQQVPKTDFPFATTIVKENEHFAFT